MLSVAVTGHKAGKPVLYEVLVRRGDGTKAYTLEKRYSDFLDLAQAFQDEMGEPVAVAPPSKPRFYETVDLEQRRRQLEQMLQALVRVPAFAQSFAVGNFLSLYSKRERDDAAESKSDFLQTSTEVSKLINAARQSADPLKKRQLVVQSKSLITNLQSGLNAATNVNTAQPGAKISAAERTRRQQQIDDFLLSVHAIEVAAAGGVQQAAPAPPPSARVLGETPSTVNLSNRALVMQQQDGMAAQDDAIKYLRTTVARQKELGVAIHDEIVRQNELLEDLDQDVNKVNAKLNYARRKTERLSR